MTNVIFESPLVNIPRLGKRELKADGRVCLLDEIPFIDMLTIRGDAGNSSFTNAVSACTGLALPVQANTASVNADRQLFWLGPDEWLLKTGYGTAQAVEMSLRAALDGQHFSTVQVGSGNTTLSLVGDAAADLLSRACPLDLHSRVFPAGALAQTHMAKANVTLYCRTAQTNYEITVRRSFADYLFRWLCEAGA
jgi:sarcosine oxidase subunit gamma